MDSMSFDEISSESHSFDIYEGSDREMQLFNDESAMDSVELTNVRNLILDFD